MAHCTCTASWNVAGSSVDLSSVLSYVWKGDNESECSEDCCKDEDPDGTSHSDPPQPLILQPPDSDTPTSCEVHIACTEHTNAAIVGLAVVSSAHHIEIFTQGGYLATGRGEVVCKPGNGSSCQQTMYHADLDLSHPVRDLFIRFVTLADRSCLVVYIIEVVLSPSKFLGMRGRVDHGRVHQILGESGVELSDGARNLMRLVESQQQMQGSAMGQQTSNMAALLPLLGMFTGTMGGLPPPTPPKIPSHAASPNPPISSSKPPVSSKTEMQGGDFSNMLQNLTLSDQAGASGLNGDLMFSMLQNVCKEVSQNRQTSGTDGRPVFPQGKETSCVDDMDVEDREASCQDESGNGLVKEEINDKPRFVTEHEMSDMESRIMGNLSSMEERIMGRVDDQLQGMQNRIESKLDAVLNAVLSKKENS